MCSNFTWGTLSMPSNTQMTSVQGGKQHLVEKRDKWILMSRAVLSLSVITL